MSRLFISALLAVALAFSGSVSARESWVGLNLRAQIAYIELNKFNASNFGIGGEASFFPHKRLLMQGRYSTSSFANGNSKDYKDYYQVDASPKIKPFTYWEAGGQINLIVRSGQFRNNSSYMDSSSSRYSPVTGKTTYTEWSTKYSWLADEHQLYGIRVGILGLQSGMPADLGKDDDTIRSANGNIIDPAKRDLTFTNHKMTGFYLGVARTRVYYREGLWRTFFIDLLVSSKTEYKDPVLSGFTERKYGGRMGFEGTRRHIGGRLETGIRPGVDGFYLLTQFTVGFML
jgi:hypothetical protein